MLKLTNSEILFGGACYPQRGWGQFQEMYKPLSRSVCFYKQTWQTWLSLDRGEFCVSG